MKARTFNSAYAVIVEGSHFELVLLFADFNLCFALKFTMLLSEMTNIQQFSFAFV